MKITEQPGTDLAELHAKVIDLEKTAQAKREELSRKRQEGKASAEKADKEKLLKDLFVDGKRFAEWTHGSAKGVYAIHIHIMGRPQDCTGDIKAYMAIIKAAFKREQYFFDYFLQYKRPEELKESFRFDSQCIHAHMEGFIETILESNPDTDALLDVVRVAMVAGADTFREFGGRQKVLGYLKTTVVDKIEEKLSTGVNLDEAGIKEIERILKKVREAIMDDVRTVF